MPQQEHTVREENETNTKGVARRARACWWGRKREREREMGREREKRTTKVYIMTEQWVSTVESRHPPKQGWWD